MFELGVRACDDDAGVGVARVGASPRARRRHVEPDRRGVNHRRRPDAPTASHARAREASGDRRRAGCVGTAFARGAAPACDCRRRRRRCRARAVGRRTRSMKVRARKVDRGARARAKNARGSERHARWDSCVARAASGGGARDEATIWRVISAWRRRRAFPVTDDRFRLVRARSVRRQRARARRGTGGL